MLIEIERELAEAMKEAKASGDIMLAKTCIRSRPDGSTGTYSVDVQADSPDAAFAELDRMVNSPNVPIERARQIRLYLAWKGHVESQFMEGENFRTGRNIAQDNALARYWLLKAAEGGHSSAQNNLGVMYAEGQGGPVDYERAVYWYMKSAAAGVAVAMSNLSINLMAGTGAKRSYSRAARLLKESLKSNPYSARNHRLLAECYEHGVGGRNGLRLAMRHYQEASDFGSLEARAALRRLSSRKSSPPVAKPIGGHT